MRQAAAIILAAGKSTRMKSDAPKVLHEVCGQPMLRYVLEACREAGASRLVVVVGYGKDEVIAAFADDRDITWIEQTEQKGTGHAALVCRKALEGFAGPVLTIAGDMPLIRAETLRALLEENERTGDAVTLATSIMDDPSGYGRIVRDGDGALIGIVEDNDCSDRQRQIREVNVSYYCFDGQRMFELLDRVGNNNAKGEYYITDTVEIAMSRGCGAGAIAAVPAQDAMGINSRSDLVKVARIMQDRIQADLLKSGVSIVDPLTTWIEAGATIAPDTTIHPMSFVGARARIGPNCRIGPHAYVPPGGEIGAGAVLRPQQGRGACG